ncbi:MAG: hypothetical protein ACRC92_27245 [Peptostreptococcaceae bacterium]
MVENSNSSLQERNDDEIINKPKFSNMYDLKVSLAGSTYSSESGNDIIYSEEKDFLNANFTSRILDITVFGEDIFTILNYKDTDANGMYDIVINALPSQENLIQNKPIIGYKFKGLLRDGDAQASLRETLNLDTGQAVQHDRPAVKTLTFVLFQEEEINLFDNDDINMLFSSIELKSLINYTINKYTTFKYVISDLDHNPDVGNILIPHMNMLEFLTLMDRDCGLYKSKYSLFLNDDLVLYLTNTDNDPKCRNADLEFSLNIRVSQVGIDNKERTIDKLSNGNFSVIVNPGDAKVYTSPASKIGNSYNYIFPNGKRYINKHKLSRNVKTIKKITNVQPLEKYTDKAMETFEVLISSVAFPRINPITTIFFFNSNSQRVSYRVSKVRTIIRSRGNVQLKVTGYRYKDEKEV